MNCGSPLLFKVDVAPATLNLFVVRRTIYMLCIIIQQHRAPGFNLKIINYGLYIYMFVNVYVSQLRTKNLSIIKKNVDKKERNFQDEK